MIRLSTSLQQVAESLEQSSFAVYRVPPRNNNNNNDNNNNTTTNITNGTNNNATNNKNNRPLLQTLIDEASTEILTFFKSNNNNNNNTNNDNDNCYNNGDSSRLRRMKYQRIIGGHLHGYNEPSSAKLLFRAFVVAAKEDDQQPWPTEKLRDVSTQLANELHLLLVDCWMTLLVKEKKKTNQRERQRQQHYDSDTNSRMKIPRRNKRIKRDNYCSSSSLSAQQDGCPLDYFFYHGKTSNSKKNDAAAADAANDNDNCTAHVDRGVLICICLSQVPGLEIYSNAVWVCPREELVDNSKNNNNNHEKGGPLVCILAGQQLNTMLQQQHDKNTISACTTTAPAISIPPCIHRVRNSLSDERLSITYEWRQQQQQPSTRY